jgi:cytochrome c-type biogenesis protein CcmH
VLALSGVAPSHAVQVDESLPDPVLEARSRTISHDLRCMVCQNQSIDDSEAPLARDLRLLVRERLKAGDSDTQVVDYLVARYGEFVLLKPRMSWHTAILWGAPLTILIIGLFAIGFSVLRRPAGPLPAVAALTEGERLKLNAIAQSQADGAQADLIS